MIEYRFSSLEVRAADGGVVEGAAMPYGTEASIAGGLFRESVDAGAFGTIGDVILNRMHDRNEPLARTEGGGLTLEDGAERLWLRADIPAYRADVRDMVKRRILRGLSVEMEVTAEDWPAARIGESFEPRPCGISVSWIVPPMTRRPPRSPSGRKRRAGRGRACGRWQCKRTPALVSPQPDRRGWSASWTAIPHSLAALGRSAGRDG